MYEHSYTAERSSSEELDGLNQPHSILVVLPEETLLESYIAAGAGEEQYRYWSNLCLSIGLLTTAGYALCLFMVPEFIWPPYFHAEVIRHWLIALWLCSTANDIWDVFGFLLGVRRNRFSPATPADGAELVVQFVSRGENSEVLINSARTALTVLNQIPAVRSGSLRTEIRLVTELSVAELMSNEEQRLYNFIVVPTDFQCRNGTLFKARALEYTRLKLDADYLATNGRWILFMDEESTLTPSSAQSTLDFIANDRHQNLLGQGLISYTGGKFAKRLLIAATDTNRVGWDLGRFRFQYDYLNSLYFGFHGSHFLASTRVVNLVGFDSGPRSSITEDIFFAAEAVVKGIKLRWLNGLVREQSTETYLDFIKQRRRWITGLFYFIFDKRYPIKHRFPLMLSTVAQRLAAFTPLAIFFSALWAALYGDRWPLGWILLGYLGAIRPGYLMGIYGTISDLPANSTPSRSVFVAGSLLLAPLVPILEAVASLYAMIARDRGFFVVTKSAAEDRKNSNA